MKKLLLLLLMCANTQMQGMEQLKEFITKTRVVILYKWYNGEKLWKDGEHHAQAIDHYVKNKGIYINGLYKDQSLQFERKELIRHDEQLNYICDKLEKIYKKKLNSMPCFLHEYDYENGSCSDHFKKFKEEVERIRKE